MTQPNMTQPIIWHNL